jgi:hypothetical protein
LRRKAATAHRSTLKIENDAVCTLLREDEDDPAALTVLAKEKTTSYEQFLANWDAE